LAGALKQVSATGDVATGSRILHSVVFTPGTAASQCDIRDGSSGAILLSFKGAANGPSIPWVVGDGNGVQFANSIHATIAGAATLAAFAFS
jgi:hypothetical protein